MTKCGEPQLWRLTRLRWLEECRCGGGSGGARTGQQWLAAVNSDRRAASGDEQRRRSDCGCGGVRADRAAETTARDSVQWRRRLGSGDGCKDEGFLT